MKSSSELEIPGFEASYILFWHQWGAVQDPPRTGPLLPKCSTQPRPFHRPTAPMKSAMGPTTEHVLCKPTHRGSILVAL